ncbi:MAG: glycosyltransferase [Acidobacteria bacterium]|nr:glycosyltransferase [Acidobacteriota bacterium]
MKILHIIGTLDPRAGGPSEYIRGLFRYGPIGYTGEAVTLDDPNAPFLKELPFPVTALGPTSSKFGYTSALAPWLEANRHRFDGVVVDGLWHYSGYAAWRTLRGRIPYMVFTHGMLDPYFKRAFPLKHVKKAFYWYLAQYWILRDAFRVLFTTQQERHLAEQSFALHTWKPYIVPCGTVGPANDEGDCIESFHQAVQSIGNRRFLLYLGRIHPKKGCDLLIDAFIKAAPLDTGLHLVMAGPDQTGWKEKLTAAARQSGVEDRIHWPGMLTGKAKWGAFFASEAFILPSHQENFGIAVAESLSCGRPVLLSNQVNIAPEIAADDAGYMEPDTLEGTVRLIERWIATTPDQRSIMRERAKALFQARYDMETTARTLLSLLELAKG